MAEDEVLTEDGAEEIHAPNDAVILSYSQMPVNYNAVPKVWLTHPDSTEEAPKLVPFTYGEVVEGMEIGLDFSAGNNITITAPDGYLVKEAKILKPENLKPENIAKDVEIAGVTGTHEGGGSTADYTIAYMSIDGTEELYLKPIMYGDTAGDVIALGLMDEPVIENTAEKEYTFLGWSDSIGGEVKTSMFETVTENRTVYAVYKVVTIVASGACGDAATWKLTDDGTFTIAGSGDMYEYESWAVRPWHGYISRISTVIIGDDITTIGTRAFGNCPALKNVSIPSNIKSINRSAFYNCTSLTKMVIPSNVKEIGLYAFYGCSSLTSVSLYQTRWNIYRESGAWYATLTINSLSTAATYLRSTYNGYIWRPEE